jgi:hypothetical protein
MTFLPLHAAGHHTKEPGNDSVMDRVISSYTPTARALIRARAAGVPASGRDPRTVVVAVPDPPRSLPLAGARREAELVRKLILDATIMPTPGDRTNQQDVIAALRAHRIAHFACHCVADLRAPVEAG